MDFKFYCIHCGQHIAASEEDQGMVGACPECGGTFTVPTLVEPSDPPPAAPVAMPPAEPSGRVPMPKRPSAMAQAPIRPPTASGVTLPKAAKPPPRSGNSLPAPHHVGPTRTAAVDLLVATEAARARRAGYWIVGGVFGAIAIGAMFMLMPRVSLVPVAATTTPKPSLAPVAEKAAAAGTDAASATGTAAVAAVAPAAAEPGKEAAPEMKAEDANKKAEGGGPGVETDQVLGSSRRAVDELLSGTWTIRPSAKRTPGVETVFYDGDVNLIVQFRSDRAVSVNVIAPTLPTPRPIGPEQYRGLMRLIGQAPKDSDVKKDAAGILEFTVGEK